MATLSAEERQFFALVGRAIQTNPFSAARDELDAQITGRYDLQDHVDAASVEVGKRLENLCKKGRGDINGYAGTDRELLESAFIFDIFHRHITRFDALIEEQLQHGNRSLPVPFAKAFTEQLEKNGFLHADALRYFEICFQLRRAFFFIQTNLVGRSPCMRKLRESLWNNVFTHNLFWYDRFLWNRMEDFSTLILGATGTGKGTAAAAIGRSGYIPFEEDKRCFVVSFTESFLSLNLSQFPPTLIESELFGHKKGSFTGATDDYKGIFERCSPYGAIFLDEIGEVSESVQIKLLQVIQERTFTPVGGHKTARFPGRVIAATNRPLEEIRGKRILRDDFFYRLCSDVITVPSLAQRIAEDPLELDDLLSHTAGRILGKAPVEMIVMLMAAVDKSPGMSYRWPGNVRELEQCVRRIMLNHVYEPDTGSEKPDPPTRLAEDLLNGRLDAQGLLSGYCLNLYQQLGTYEAVARQTKLDRRTVKKYILGVEENSRT